MNTWKQHAGNGQPIETSGKWVAYKTFGGHQHLPYLADELNWRTDNHRAPEIGIITEYRIVK